LTWCQIGQADRAALAAPSTSKSRSGPPPETSIQHNAQQFACYGGQFRERCAGLGLGQRSTQSAADARKDGARLQALSDGNQISICRADLRNLGRSASLWARKPLRFRRHRKFATADLGGDHPALSDAQKQNAAVRLLWGAPHCRFARASGGRCFGRGKRVMRSRSLTGLTSAR